MRGFVIFCLCLVLNLCQGQKSLAQVTLRYNSDKPVICYLSHETRPDHVPVSDKFKRLRQSGTARVKTSAFEVEYVDFPEDNHAKTAFQYAVEIWESELSSPIPIRIRAQWADLESGVLAQALWSSAYANFGGEQHMNTFYPVALAEKISGTELNKATEPDIVASFNRNVSWYLGVDGLTPKGQMDLVTIVLHEIAHGLGFSDTYSVKGDEGSVGLPRGGESVPFIFDVFVENANRENLLHEFESPSRPLGSALLSTDLFFDGVLSVEALEGSRPELYAPTTYNSGSSVSHLDETIFAAPRDANRLMTPQIAYAESIHNPGDVARAMLNDMGWVYTRIVHEALNDTEQADGQPYQVSAFIHSDNGYDPGAVKLHYSSDGKNFTTASMLPTGTPHQFRASLPGSTGRWAYAYYISVVDIANRTFTSPGKIQKPGADPEQGTHFFNIGPDTKSPDIVHEPVNWISEADAEVEIVAEVTDNVGVKEVVLEYFINQGVIQTVVMDNIFPTDEYETTISLPGPMIGDQLRYRIIARDLAGTENFAQLPLDGYYLATVTGIMPVRDFYVADFNGFNVDFFGNGFSITTPGVFKNGAIHSDHPYQNGTGVNDDSSYTYQLQVPIRINDTNPVVAFDEIVLVEPGEDGSLPGSSEFYDYVVVEGSIDDGNTWNPFAPAYDARDRSVWLTRYNSDVVDENSDSEGDSTLYRQRMINMVENGNFSPGDEVLIRFRLFADQFAHGWGWAIDNLSIQESAAPVTDVEHPLSASFSVYPVPAKSDLFVEVSEPHESLRLTISDMQGKIVYDEMVEATEELLREGIDIQSFLNGLYILKAQTGNRIYYRKFVKTD